MSQREAMLIPEIQRVWHANRPVYGADQVWRQMSREGIRAGRSRHEWY